MKNNHFLQNIINKNLRLFEKKRMILTLPPEKAIDIIFESNAPATFIQSFAEEDFYFLINDYGITDSIQLLSMASSQQWEFIMDIELWEKDKLKIDNMTNWLEILMKADSNRLVNWLIIEKLELFEFYLFKNIEVKIKEKDQDPSDFDQYFFTYDDYFYIRFIDFFVKENQKVNHKHKIISKLLKKISEFGNYGLQNILLEAMNIIPAEIEEEDYRLKNVRLAEKGFLPFNEAIEIYSFIKPEEIDSFGIKKNIYLQGEILRSPIPQYPFTLLNQKNKFTNSLELINDDDIFLQIQAEFATLSNQIISADQKIIKEKMELGQIVSKACGYINIGIEALNKEFNPDNKQAALFIKKYTLSHIFRVGYGYAIRLKCKAKSWNNKSWYQSVNLPITFWDEKWVGAIGGLLLKKPLFFDNYRTSNQLYKEFTSMTEITEIDKILDDIKNFDFLFSLMNINYQFQTYQTLTYKTLILTMWARYYLKLQGDILHLTLKEFEAFFKHLFSKNYSVQNQIKKINFSMKENFLNWIVQETDLNKHEIYKTMRNSLEILFTEIENEYGMVETENLDSKYINMFLLKDNIKITE